MNDRESMLAALRNGLCGTTAPPLPPVLPSPELPGKDCAERFATMLRQVGGACEQVRDLAAAARRVAELLAAAEVRSLAVSDAPELAGVLEALPPTIRVYGPESDRTTLLAADCGLSTAQVGIAETGSLVLVAADERHRLCSLLPPRHLVLLPCSRLCASLGAALAALSSPDGRPRSPTVTFVTGPSRTADIELELVIGVHGPRHLHVLLIELP
ncbi:MAG: lactate utilization protein [Planctomycetes bacterium]|nr:lactate utilization protein [Planctomycetota bacterium]